jgi:nucleoside-diphosphate-sugar epimerase
MDMGVGGVIDEVRTNASLHRAHGSRIKSGMTTRLRSTLTDFICESKIMTSSLLIFGPGYTATRIAHTLIARGWSVDTVGRAQIDDRQAVAAKIARASHILSSVPPEALGDPVLLRHAAALMAAPARWIGYLSSTGVYGDSAGAWIDESAPIGTGRRGARAAADAAWQALHPAVHVFRLPGIYGPGRSALDRVKAGHVHRLDLPDQVFSRVHVDDIVGGVLAGIDREKPGIYNLADDRPTSQNMVIEAACDLLGKPWPPLQSLDDAGLSPMARAFYSENRRIANGRAKRLLGWRPLFPDYAAGLRALSAMTRPVTASTAPPTAVADQI